MPLTLPVWLRGVTFGSRGDVYTVDTNNGCLEMYVCYDDEFHYKKPLSVKLPPCKSLVGAQPLDITYVHFENGYSDTVVLTTDNKSLIYLTKDLNFRQIVSLTGRCTGICQGVVLNPGLNMSPKPALFTLNATESTIDILSIDGQKSHSVSLPKRIGFCEKHGYICSCIFDGENVVILSSSCGVYVGTLDPLKEDDFMLNIRYKKLADEAFSPKGVCVVGETVYIANSRKHRVEKMLLQKGLGNLELQYCSYMSVTSPCAIDGKQIGKSVWICVTTLTGSYELLEF